MGRTRYIRSKNGSRAKTSRPLPPGIIFAVPIAVVPPGCLACDGTAVKKRRYPELYAHLQSKYGAAAASTVTLPDLNGRSIAHVGPNADVSGLNSNDGLVNGSRSPKHSHTAPSHSHSGLGHTHTSAAHAHAGESHAHNEPTHSHGEPAHNHSVTGQSAATAQFKAAATGGNTAASHNHSHADGSIAAAAVAGATGSTFPGDTGAGGAAHDSASPGATGSSSISSSVATTPPNTDGGTVPFLTVLWVITTGR